MIKKNLIKILGTTSLLLSFVCTSPSQVNAQSPFNRTNIPAQIQVTVPTTNVRSGPSTSFMKVATAYNGQKINCLGKINTWWVVHMANDTVGLIYGPNAKPYYPPAPAPAPTQPAPTASSYTLTADEQQMLDLINARRAKEGLKSLVIDATLQSVANARCEKIVSSGVMSHQLPDLGSPFDTMKSFGVSYNYAGENLAGNSSVSAAETALENDPPHLQNIISPNFNYVGIRIMDSSKYGKVFVQDFIGR